MCQEKHLWSKAQNIQEKLNLIYLNNDMDRGNGSTDLLDITFESPNLAKHDFQFQTGDDLDSHHLSIKVSIIGTHLLTTSGTNSIRPTEKCLNQHSRQL